MILILFESFLNTLCRETALTIGIKLWRNYKRKRPLKVFISKGVHIAVAQNLIPKIPSKRVSDKEEGKDCLGLIIPFNESVRVSPDLL